MWDTKKQTELHNSLIENSDEKYKKFNSGLLPGVENILGVRMPKLKKMAKEILADDWKGFIESQDNGIYEERMIKGIVIAKAKIPIEEKLGYIENFVDLIDNWAVCDCFCAALKPKKSEKEAVFDFALKYVCKQDEFKARVGIVIIIDIFFTDEYIDKSFEALKNVTMGKYYVDMALAWALSIGLIKYEQKTLEFMKNTYITNFVYNKALQKARESTRVSQERKDFYNSLKRRNVAKI